MERRTSVEIFGGRQMGAENASPRMTRRVLLTVAGATLLSVWTADPLRPGTAAPRTPDPRRARARATTGMQE